MMMINDGDYDGNDDDGGNDYCVVTRTRRRSGNQISNVCDCQWADNEDANILTMMMMIINMVMMMMLVVFGNRISNVCGRQPPTSLPTLSCGFRHPDPADEHHLE